MARILVTVEAQVRIKKVRGGYQILRVFPDGSTDNFAFGKTSIEAIRVAKNRFKRSQRGKIKSVRFMRK